MNSAKTNTAPKHINWFILFVLSLSYFAVNLSNKGFLSILPFLKDEFTLTGFQIGLYQSLYFLSATAVAILSGRIVDIIGSKKGIVIGVACVGIFMLFHSVAANYSFILFFAFLTGIGFSIITPSINTANMDWAPLEKRALFMGLLQSGSCIGSFLGASLFPVITGLLNWRKASFMAGCIAIIISLIIYRYYYDINNEDYHEKKKRIKSTNLKDELFRLLKNRNFLAVCILGFVFGSTLGSLSSYFALYLNQDLGLDKTLCGLGLGLLQLGGMIGRPGWGLFCDKFINGDRRKGLFIIGISIFAFCSIFALFTYLNVNIIYIFLLSFLLGIPVSGWFALFFTSITELADKKQIGIASGLSLVFIRTGVVLFPPFFGLLSDLSGSFLFSWILISVFVICSSFIFFFLTNNKEND